MTEQSPHRAPVTWNVEALSAALGAQPETIPDPAFGDGLRYELGKAGMQTLDLYPGAEMARLRLPYTEVTLYRLNAPILAPCQVVFEREDAAGLCHFSVTAKGEVTLLFAPASSSDIHPVNLGAEHEAAYVAGLAQLTPTVEDDYGFDDAEYARLLSEGFGSDPQY